MSRKNPDLCECPYCRKPYTKILYRFRYSGKRVGAALKVCDAHAITFERLHENDSLTRTVARSAA